MADLGEPLGLEFPPLPQPLADTIEEFYTELLFKFFQGSTGCRLRHCEVFGGAAHILVVGRGQENLQLSERVAHLYIGKIN